MNAAQIHLALNHVPIAMVLIGVLLLAVALFRKSKELRYAAATLLMLSAVGTVPVFLSGEPAEEIVEHRPAVSENVIHTHEEAAELSLVLIGILGLASLGGWLFERLKKPAPSAAWVGLLVLGLVNIGSFARTAHLGGLIRHDELGASTVHNSAERGEQGTREDHDDD